MKLRWFKLGLLGAGGGYLLRYWGVRWGATDAEVHAALPGDAVVPHPMLETTHAITIRAAAADVWPWLVQMGYYRGGWYTDTDWWDYLPDRFLRSLVRKESTRSGYVHRDAPSATQIMPEFQQLAVGDVILDGPPGTAYFVVTAQAPQRLLALRSTTHLRFVFPRAIRDNPRAGIGGEFSWVFLLREADENSTRLVLRMRGNAQPWWYRVVVYTFIPIADLVLARKMLRGIKQRAEACTGRTRGSGSMRHIL